MRNHQLDSLAPVREATVAHQSSLHRDKPGGGGAYGRTLEVAIQASRHRDKPGGGGAYGRTLEVAIQASLHRDKPGGGGVPAALSSRAAMTNDQ